MTGVQTCALPILLPGRYLYLTFFVGDSLVDAFEVQTTEQGIKRTDQKALRIDQGTYEVYALAIDEAEHLLENSQSKEPMRVENNHDYIWCSTSLVADAATTNIALQFVHQTARLAFRFQPTEGITLKRAQVTPPDATDCLLNRLNGQISETSKLGVAVDLELNEDHQAEFSIVPLQSGKTLIAEVEVTLKDGTNRHLQTELSTTKKGLEAGTCYYFDLNITEHHLQLSSVGVTGWKPIQVTDKPIQVVPIGQP